MISPVANLKTEQKLIPSYQTSKYESQWLNTFENITDTRCKMQDFHMLLSSAETLTFTQRSAKVDTSQYLSMVTIYPNLKAIAEYTASGLRLVHMDLKMARTSSSQKLWVIPVKNYKNGGKKYYHVLKQYKNYGFL